MSSNGTSVPVVEAEVMEMVETDGGAMVAALNRAEIDIQIATAKRHPRSIAAFREEVMAMATLDEETAATMFYALPRSGKTIEGPSIRLAEVAASAWGNIRHGARVVDVGEKVLTAQGYCFDLQKNIATAIEVRRRITDSKGRRYNEDMITVTGNAAGSIALRNAVFKVIPFALLKPAYEAARQASIGKALTMEQRRTNALGWFAKAGAPNARVFALLGVKGLDDITIDHLITLQGLRTAIKEEQTTVDEVFAQVSTSPGASAPPSTPDPLMAKVAPAAPATAPATSAHAPAPQPHPPREPGSDDGDDDARDPAAEAMPGDGGPAPADLRGFAQAAAATLPPVATPAAGKKQRSL